MSASSGMAGKSFKGNLEVLNLSDIFQSLAMNRHSGTLIVTDGKREKKIFFAEGEITLLSSSRRQRLGELLVAEGKISDDELELALKLQKQSRKRLGEILVEEGFCTEEDIDRLVRQQIEEEIYDLFLWRKAEFEFIADQMPEDMARESPNLTRLAFNTNSLIMEALRRLDEWSLIRNLVPTTKEVFVLTNPDALRQANVPERMRTEALTLVDGRTTVEGLAERFLVSEFEMCKHLAEMVQASAIRALRQEELAERAEEAYALNDFSAAAALYGRLAEYLPDVPKILIPLADSLRRSGAEKQALVIYEQLATQLESSGSGDDRLRRCYEAITQLDPTRVDLARRLEEMDLKQLTAPSRVGKLPLVLAVLFGVGALGLVALKRWNDGRLNPEEDAAAAKKLLVELDEAKLDATSGPGRNDEAAYERWFQKGMELYARFPRSPEARKVTLPVLVATTPAGFKVYVNERPKGLTQPDAPFLVCEYDPATSVLVELRRPDGESGSSLWKQALEAKTWHGVVRANLLDRPDATCVDDLRLDAHVVWSESLKAWLSPSRTGKLRALRPADLGSVPRWDGIELGENGDIFSDPLVVPVGGGERFLVGGVEGGVLSIDLGSGDPPAEPVQRRYPAASPIVAAPAFVPPDVVADGRVVLGSVSGEIKAYPLDGGKPVWTATAEAGVRVPLVTLGGGRTVVVAADDATVTAFDAADGGVRWQWEAPAFLTGPLRPLGPERLLVQLDGGRVLVLDGATGQESWSWQGAEPQRLCTDPTGARFFVAGGGKVRAFTGEGQQPIWEVELPRTAAAPAAPPRLAVRGERLIVAQGYTESSAGSEQPAVLALQANNGRLAWQAIFPELRGEAVRLTVTPQGSFVSTTARTLYLFSNEEY